MFPQTRWFFRRLSTRTKGRRCPPLQEQILEPYKGGKQQIPPVCRHPKSKSVLRQCRFRKSYVLCPRLIRGVSAAASGSAACRFFRENIINPRPKSPKGLAAGLIPWLPAPMAPAPPSWPIGVNPGTALTGGTWAGAGYPIFGGAAARADAGSRVWLAPTSAGLGRLFLWPLLVAVRARWRCCLRCCLWRGGGGGIMLIQNPPSIIHFWLISLISAINW